MIIKTTRKIKDKYNDNKVWIIIRTKCRHYYFAQEICGKQYCRKVRTTKKTSAWIIPRMVLNGGLYERYNQKYT